MAPPPPPEASPLVIVKDPEDPKLEDPVAKAMAPLTPAPATLPVLTSKGPLLDRVACELATRTEPPLPVAAVPPLTVREPPLSALPRPKASPPTMRASPPSPPLLPWTPVPVPPLIVTRPPDLPQAELRPDRMRTSPPSKVPSPTVNDMPPEAPPAMASPVANRIVPEGPPSPRPVIKAMSPLRAGRSA